jgi:hypothetical protein
MWVLPTVTASTMITQLCGRHKVRCHKRVVDFSGCVAKSLTSHGIAAHLPKIAEGGASSVMIVPARMGQPPD